MILQLIIIIIKIYLKIPVIKKTFFSSHLRSILHMASNSTKSNAKPIFELHDVGQTLEGTFFARP